jgi:hypothetical protein
MRLLESGDSLSGLWSSRYPDSRNERKRVLGVLRSPVGAIADRPRKTRRPQLGLWFYYYTRNTQFGSNNAEVP